MAGLVKDVVCKMDVDPDTALASSEYRDQTYYFCAEGCKLAFDANPSKYVGDAAQQAQAASGGTAGRRWWEFWKS